MIKGQRVICVNDVFTPSVRALYQQLPVKHDVYTIREVFLGREKIVRGGETNYVSATLTLYMSIYNLFTSLLQLLMAFSGNRD